MADEPQEPQEPTRDDLMDAIRGIKVGQFLLSTASTLASLAYGKLDGGETAEAKAAIDAIQALMPVLEGQIEEPLRRDFDAALANLKVAYAAAVSRPE